MKFLRVSYIAAIVAVLFAQNYASAQNIYLLVAADTKDRNIGKADELDLYNVQGAFGRHVPEHQLRMYSGFASDEGWHGPPVQGADDMKGAILQALNRCPAGENDTVVFYWSGHGQYDDNGHYLVMPDRKALYRKEVIAAIRRKSPRLAVVISDSCNVFLESKLLQEPAMAAPAVERISPLFESLFIQYKGLLDMNAASEGETAGCFETCGGFFTCALANAGEGFSRGRHTGRGIDIEFKLPSGRNRKVELPLGYLHTHADRREGWNDLITHVNQTVRTKWRGATNQTIRVWSLPERITGGGGNGGGGGGGGNLPRVLSLTRGDVILSINGNPIRDEAACRRAVRNSGRLMRFTVRDSRDGTVWRMETTLQNGRTRFGTHLADAPGGGALVTGVVPRSPATSNRVLERVEGGGRPIGSPGRPIGSPGPGAVGSPGPSRGRRRFGR